MNKANVVKSTNPRMRHPGRHLPVKNLIHNVIAYCYDLEGCIEPVTSIPVILSLQQQIAATEKRYKELQELNTRMANERDTCRLAMCRHEKNNKTISQFFAMHGSETPKLLSAFLVEMMALYTASPENYDQWHREETAMHFGMLYKLVNGLREVG